MPHDSNGATLGYTADQLVRVAFQLRVEGAFDTVGTVVLDHDSEDRQHIFGRTRDCRGASQVSQEIQDKLHISMFHLLVRQIPLHYDPPHSLNGLSELALQQTEAVLDILVCGRLFSNVVSGILWSSTIFFDNHYIVVSHVSIRIMHRHWSVPLGSSLTSSQSCFGLLSWPTQRNLRFNKRETAKRKPDPFGDHNR